MRAAAFIMPVDNLLVTGTAMVPCAVFPAFEKAEMAVG